MLEVVKTTENISASPFYQGSDKLFDDCSMRFLDQWFKVLMKNYEEFEARGFYYRADWIFMKMYAMALAVLQVKDDQIEFKAMIFKKLLREIDPINSRRYKMLQQFKEDGSSVVMFARDKINANKSKVGGFYGDCYKVGMIGILCNEYPEGGI